MHSKQLKLLPFAMQPAFPASDYYGNSASMTDIRVNSLAIPLMPSLVHMLDYPVSYTHLTLPTTPYV